MIGRQLEGMGREEGGCCPAEAPMQMHVVSSFKGPASMGHLHRDKPDALALGITVKSKQDKK